MKINLHLIRDDLSQFDLQGHLPGMRTVATISTIRIGVSCTNTCEDEVLYVLDAQSMPPCDAETMRGIYLCAGRPNDEWLQHERQILYTELPVKPEELLNEVLGVVCKYARWEQSLQDAVDKRLSYTELAERSAGIFRNPIYAEGPGHVTFFHCLPNSYTEKDEKNNYRSWPIHLEREGDTMNDRDMGLLLGNPEFSEHAKATEPTYWKAYNTDYAILYFNIFRGPINTVRILIEETIEPLCDRDWLLIQVLANYVGKMSYSRLALSVDKPREISKIMEPLINHVLLPEPSIEKLLNVLNWKSRGNYLCIVFCFLDKQDDSTKQWFVFELEKLLGICNLIQGETIIFVSSLDEMGVSIDRLAAEIESFLRKRFVAAGFSMRFEDFKEVYYFYRQALAAVDYGMKKGGIDSCFKYEDCQLHDLLLQATHRKSLASIVPEGLKCFCQQKKGQIIA